MNSNTVMNSFSEFKAGTNFLYIITNSTKLIPITQLTFRVQKETLNFFLLNINAIDALLFRTFNFLSSFNVLMNYLLGKPWNRHLFAFLLYELFCNAKPFFLLLDPENIQGMF